MTGDEVTLTLPGGREFYRIVHLVLGGLAIRLDLTYEQLEDLQLALDSVLSEASADGDVTVSVSVEGRSIRTAVGPFRSGRLRAAVESADEEQLNLRRLLETVVDRVSVDERDGGEWIELTKSLEPGGAS
ncbi:MAG: hypothetical protein ICV67_00630 [Thermoleophilia bacterium]|nr:hypothetical protein [Thermoleophilia bacterium]